MTRSRVARVSIHDEQNRADPVAAGSADASPDQTQGHDGAVKPGSVASGTGYRAMVSDDERRLWSCSHVHFTEHSARACAEQHLRTWAPP